MEKKTTPANTRQRARRRNAFRGAAASTATQLLTAVVLLWLRAGTGGFVSKVLLLAALADIAAILPVWAALRVRLEEIERGEEEDASQY